MSKINRRYFRNSAVALALLIGLALVAPYFLNAGRYRSRLKTGLEQSFGRKVTIGHIALHFFPQLGFTVDNVVVDEDPAFGVEPFVRVGSIDCDLQWRSLWSSHLYIGTLRLVNPSINLVRNSAGRWNIENLLLKSGIKTQASGSGPHVQAPAKLAVEIEGARLNFKLDENKKPFAIVDTRAHLDLDYGSDRIDFEMAGDPVRTDLELPTPGLVELDGSWSPARKTGHTLDATLRMQGALLYDWIPLLTGRNPEVYGVMNSTIHLSGSLRQIDYSGELQLSQLHRWEQLPSSNDIPCDLRFRGRFDRNKRNLLIKGMDLAFANSELHLEGSISSVTSWPHFDLVVAFERSRLQDLLALGSRVVGKHVKWNVVGRLNGMVSLQGPWRSRRYGGFLNAHAVRLETRSGTFPVSDVAIRITRSGLRLAPARVMLARGVEVVAEGTVRHISPRLGGQKEEVHPVYQLTAYSRAVDLGRLVHFGRALGILETAPLEAEGIGSFTLHLTGGAWPWTRPVVTAKASVRSARLVVPGLRGPLNIPRARIQVYGKQIIINPILAVMGTSVFSGWVTHQRASHAPWNFNLKADKLSVEQARQWFEGVDDRNHGSFFERLSALGSLIRGRRPSFRLAGNLDVRGLFSTPLLTYRNFSLRDVRANINVRDRKIHFAKVDFEAGNGRGEATARLDLTKVPARLSGQAEISGANVRSLRPFLPPVLAGLRGYYSAKGSFEARGLKRSEIAQTLEGKASLQLENINLGDFNPVRRLALRLGMKLLDTSPQRLFIPVATAHLHIQDRQVELDDFPVEVAGAEFQLRGRYSFDGSTRLKVHADLRGVRKSLEPVGRGVTVPASRMADLRFAGTLRNLEMVPSTQISQTQP